MAITLTPEQEQLLTDLVDAGRFRSKDEALERALELGLDSLQHDVQPSPEDIAAIREGLDQLDRGEGIPFEQFKADLKRKYGLKD